MVSPEFAQRFLGNTYLGHEMKIFVFTADGERLELSRQRKFSVNQVASESFVARTEKMQ